MEHNEIPTKRVADSRSEQIRRMRYQYLNGQRRLFGGVLMQWIDELASIVAARHCRCNIITAAVDNLMFKEPAFLEDLVVMQGYITYVGRTSMEVRIDTYTEKPDGVRRHINEAYLVMVALDENNQPTAVPRLELVSEEEKREWALGEKRNALRKERRKERY